MNFLFICGCLQPGKDGVGDYTRRLAGEIMRQGHKSTIAAINDVHAIDPLQECQVDAGNSVQVLRLPKTSPWKERLNSLQGWIKNESPDWISLQFVPFAFHDKGLPISLAGHLKRISGEHKWHIMFHELWVGSDSLKFWFLGQVQKRLIAYLVKKLDSKVVHTHLPRYYDDLISIDIQVNELPLFSNFGDGEQMIKKKPAAFRVGFFNQVANDNRVFEFLVSLHGEILKNEMQLEILLIGDAKSSIKNFGEKLQDLPQFKDRILYTGFLSKDEITLALSSCNLGITPLAYSTLGKSGTAAAFLSLGIPMGVPNRDFKRNPFFNLQILEALVTEPKLEIISKASIAAKDCRQTIHLQRIANIFLCDLINSNEDD